MSAFARTEASGLLVHQGRLTEGCEGLAEMVDTWYRAGEWAQQWHTLSRCVIALDRIGQHDIAAQVLGAIEAHTTLGGPPVMTTLRDLAFETRDSLAGQLGADRMEQQRTTGASMSVVAIVDRTRNALLGRASRTADLRRVTASGSHASSMIEVGVQMADQLGRVGTDPIDEARLAAA